MTREFTGFAQLRSRYGAFLIDALLFMVLWFLGALLAGSLGLQMTRWNALALLAAYFGLLPATPLQGTPGKRACSLKIVDTSGRRIGLARSLARFAASIPSLGLFGAGFVVAAWTRRRQAVHDLVAGTLVVQIHENAPGDAPRLSWPARIGAGLVVGSSAYAVYLLVFIYHAILARDATQEMWQGVGEYRLRVEEALVQGKPMPPPPKPTPSVKSVSVNPGGSIIVETIDTISPDGRYLLAPTVEGEHVTWKCSAANIPTRLVPPQCRP